MPRFGRFVLKTEKPKHGNHQKTTLSQQWALQPFSLVLFLSPDLKAFWALASPPARSFQIFFDPQGTLLYENPFIFFRTRRSVCISGSFEGGEF